MMPIRRIKIEVIVGGIIIYAAVATILRVHQLFYMLSAIVLLPLVAELIGRASVTGIEASRDAPGEATAEETFEVRLSLRNTAWFRKFSLQIEDQLSPWLEPQGPPGAIVPGLMAGEPVGISYRLRAVKRGVHSIGPLRVLASDPLGLREYWRSIDIGDEIVVYPSPFALPDFRFTANESLGRIFRRKRLPEPDGMDFHRLREYVPGDDLRRVHWRTTARRGKLTVVDYEDTEVVDVGLALDLCRGCDIGSGRHTAEEYGVDITVSLAKRALQLGGSVRLLAAGARDQSLPDRSGAAAFQPILEALARVRSGAQARFAEVLERWSVSARPGTAVVIVSPAADPAIADIVRRLVATRVHVTVVFLDARSFADHAFGRGQKLSAPQRALLQGPGSAAAYLEDLQAAGARVFSVRCMDHLQSRLVAPSVLVA